MEDLEIDANIRYSLRFIDEQIIESSHKEAQFIRVSGGKNLCMRVKVSIDLQHFFPFYFFQNMLS